MALFDSAVDEAKEVLGKGSEAAKAESFNIDFNVGDWDEFGSSDNIGSVTDADYSDIARFTVPSNTEYAYGYGSAKNPDNQGYLYVQLDDSGGNTDIEGKLRLVQRSSTGRQIKVVAEYDSNRLDASKSNRDKQVPLPEQIGHPKVGEDGELAMQLKLTSSSSDTVDTSNTEVIVPVTEYDLTQ